MTQIEYAQYKGVYPGTINYHVKNGHIKVDGNGLIDPATADADWAVNVKQFKGSKRRKPRDGANVAPGATTHTTTGAAQAAVSSASPPLPIAAPDFSRARAAREVYEARITQLEYEEKRGTLISRSEVEERAFTRARNLRDSLMNIPSRLAARLASETDARAVHDVLLAEIRATMDAFVKAGTL